MVVDFEQKKKRQVDCFYPGSFYFVKSNDDYPWLN